MGKGRRKENELAKQLYRRTTEDVVCYPAGYSGSNAFPAPDLVIIDQSTGRVFVDEHKVRNCDTADYVYMNSGDDSGEFTDLFEISGQLLDRDGFHEMADSDEWLRIIPVFSVSMSNRELLVVQPHYSDDTPVESVATSIPDPFAPYVTDSGSLRLTKPSTKSWSSKTTGRDDADVLIDELGLPRATDIAIEGE